MNATVHDTGYMQTGIVRFDRQMAWCIGGRMMEVDGSWDWELPQTPVKFGLSFVPSPYVQARWLST
jgi:hypothetical protein